MRKFGMLILVCLLLTFPVAAVYAAPPPDGPPGLERAIEVKEKHEKAILEVQGVTGVAVGLNGSSVPVVMILTETPGVRGLPTSLGGVPVEMRVSGKLVALPKGGKGGRVDPTARFERPVPIGVSTGHPDMTAGTIGARVTDGEDVFALSNKHVYADGNAAELGDAVIQPGTFDGGVSPADDIGTLYDFEPIVFGGADNIMDAAIALSSIESLGNATPKGGYGTPKSETVAADLSMKVKKYGRTTGLTKGQIIGIDGTVDIEYGPGQVARFVHQIIISPGAFSSGGDSGSLIVTDAKGRDASSYSNKPVGLLFAGSPWYTIANPIDEVLSRFGVTIDGE